MSNSPHQSSPHEEKRFLVALSFPGEKRRLVEAVASHLSKVLGRERVFYDKYYESELAKPNLDIYLGNIYRDDSLLVVPFFCEDYQKKKWCNVEWKSIRASIFVGREDDTIMPIRLDKALVEGLECIDGYIYPAGRKSEEIAKLILERLERLRKNPPLPPPRPERKISRIVVVLAVFLLALTILLFRSWDTDKPILEERVTPIVPPALAPTSTPNSSGLQAKQEVTSNCPEVAERREDRGSSPTETVETLRKEEAVHPSSRPDSGSAAILTSQLAPLALTGHQGQFVRLSGRLADAAKGENRPNYLDGVELKVIGANDVECVTAEGGEYCLRFPNTRFHPGMKVTLDHNKTGYQFFYPMRGIAYLPESEIDVVDLLLLPEDSLLFQSHDDLESLFRSVMSRPPVRPVWRDLTDGEQPFDTAVKEMAVFYGLKEKYLHHALNVWQDDFSTSGDLRQQGMVLAAEGNFSGGAELFLEAAKQRSEKSVEDYQLAGDAYFDALEYEKARRCYALAIDGLNSEADRATSNSLRFRRANAGLRMAWNRADPTSTHLLEGLIVEYQALLADWNRDQSPGEWAAAQVNLGQALWMKHLGSGEGLPDRERLVVEAIFAMFKASEIFTFEAYPDEWARCRYTLGRLIENIASRAEGDHKLFLITQVIDAYRDSLRVHRRYSRPREWALVQYRFATALADLSCRVDRELSARTLIEAVDAYQEALDTLENEPRGDLYCMVEGSLKQAQNRTVFALLLATPAPEIVPSVASHSLPGDVDSATAVPTALANPALPSSATAAWTTDITQAARLAAQRRVPILVYFRSDASKHQSASDAVVFDIAILPLLQRNNVLLVLDLKSHPDQGRRFNVLRTPTLAQWTIDGKELIRLWGDEITRQNILSRFRL